MTEPGETGEVVAGRYAIEATAGRGGSATVFRARDLRDDSVVALKVLHAEFSGSRAAERFSVEIRLLEEFAHPNILPMLDSGEWNGRPFYVMRYVAGESLQDRLRRERRLPYEDVVRIGRELCAALGYAHARNVVHRDVKPANVMLVGDNVYLTDFGIAKALEPLPGQLHSTTGVARGTRAYMSPEQAMADRELDHRSDIFSLGCVLYEMIAGQNPFQSADESRMLIRRVTDAPDPLSRHRDGVPAGIEAVVMRALAKEPADRWGTAGEMGEGLAASGVKPISRARRRWMRAVAAIMLTLAAWQLARGVTSAGVGSEQSIGAIDWLSSRFAVIPVAETDAQREFSAEVSAMVDALHASLASQRGITLLALQPSGPRTPLTRGEAIECARRGGVRILAVVTLERRGESTFATITLLDAFADSVVRTEEVPVLRPDLISRSAIEALRTATLRRFARSTLRDDPNATMDYRALRTYQVALQHIEVWQLDSARAALLRALEFDPRMGTAHLLLGLLAFWSSDPNSIVGDHASRALSLVADGDSQGHLTARALEALAHENFQLACTELRRIAASDPLSFSAWFSVGDCLRRDPVVMRDLAHGSKWRFRSDLREAEAAYRRALPLAGRRLTGITYERVLSLYYVRSGAMRIGVSEGLSSERFAAFPSLRNGETAFEPLPLSEIVRAPTGSVPASLYEGLEHERRRQRSLTLAWMKSDPSNPLALAHHALALEGTGEVQRDPSIESEAVRLLYTANAIPGNSAQRVRNANALVRLELKQEHYRHAAGLADSLLKENPNASREEAAMLAPLAALLGRTSDVTRYLASAFVGQPAPGEWPEASPDPLLRHLLAEVVAHVAAGDCNEVTGELWERINTTAMAVADSLTADRQISEQLERSRLLYTPCDTGRLLLAGDRRTTPMRSLLQSAARADTDEVDRRFREIMLGRVGASAAETSWDAVFLESWALERVGLTTIAAQHLDRSFVALPRSAPFLTEDVAAISAYVRAIELRAQLFLLAGDAQQAELKFQVLRMLGRRVSAVQAE